MARRPGAQETAPEGTPRNIRGTSGSGGHRAVAAALLVTVACGSPAVEQAKGPATNKTAPAKQASPKKPPVRVADVPRLEIGAEFPAAVYENLNPSGPPTLELGDDLGERTVVLYYWIAGNLRAEQVFGELDRLAEEVGRDRLALYGVAVPRDDLATAKAIRNRVQMMGVRAPVIEDADFAIGKQLGVENVPHISVIDSIGRLRLTNGASLLQEVAPELDLAAVLRRAATTGEVASHGVLGRYFPVKELEGRPYPDFRAPLLASEGERSLGEMLDEDKLNVLVFWSVDCSHCREELPEINDWMRENPDGGVHVVSCARIPNAPSKVRTQEFCDQNALAFPTLLDEDASIYQLYGVTTTPTLVIIRPDGVVDSAIVSHSHQGPGFGATIEAKKRQLLQDQSS